MAANVLNSPEAVKMSVYVVRGDTLRNPAFYAGDNLATFGCVIATARRDCASNPAKPDAADGKRSNDTFFKN